MVTVLRLNLSEMTAMLAPIPFDAPVTIAVITAILFYSCCGSAGLIPDVVWQLLEEGYAGLEPQFVDRFRPGFLLAVQHFFPSGACWYENCPETSISCKHRFGVKSWL